MSLHLVFCLISFPLSFFLFVKIYMLGQTTINEINIDFLRFNLTTILLPFAPTIPHSHHLPYHHAIRTSLISTEPNLDDS